MTKSPSDVPCSTIQCVNLNDDRTGKYVTPKVGDQVRIIVWKQASGIHDYAHAFQELKDYGGRVGIIQGFTETETHWPKIIVQFSNIGWQTFDYFMVQKLESL